MFGIRLHRKSSTALAPGPSFSPRARMSGTERPTTKQPREKNPERNGLEKAEKNTAMDVTSITLTKSNHTAFTMAASKLAPSTAGTTPRTTPITAICTDRVSSMPSHLPSTNSQRHSGLGKMVYTDRKSTSLYSRRSEERRVGKE